MFYAVEPLIGSCGAQAACLCPIFAELEIIEQREQARKRTDIVRATVQAGFQPGVSDLLKNRLLLCRVAALTHQADAGDQPPVACDQRVQIPLQGLTDILLKVWRMAATAAKDTV